MMWVVTGPLCSTSQCDHIKSTSLCVCVCFSLLLISLVDLFRQLAKPWTSSGPSLYANNPNINFIEPWPEEIHFCMPAPHKLTLDDTERFSGAMWQLQSFHFMGFFSELSISAPTNCFFASVWWSRLIKVRIWFKLSQDVLLVICSPRTSPSFSLEASLSFSFFWKHFSSCHLVSSWESSEPFHFR